MSREFNDCRLLSFVEYHLAPYKPLNRVGRSRNMNHTLEVPLYLHGFVVMRFIYRQIADCIKQCLIQFPDAFRLVVTGLKRVLYILKLRVDKVFLVNHAANLMS